jgi:hypothetical protein
MGLRLTKGHEDALVVRAPRGVFNGVGNWRDCQSLPSPNSISLFSCVLAKDPPNYA